MGVSRRDRSKVFRFQVRIRILCTPFSFLNQPLCRSRVAGERLGRFESTVLVTGTLFEERVCCHIVLKDFCGHFCPVSAISEFPRAKETHCVAPLTTGS